MKNDDDAVVIDLEEIKKGNYPQALEETLSDITGHWLGVLMKATYGTIDLPFRLQGQRSDIRELIKAMGMEKRYLNVAKSYGLDHPVTYRNKAKLDRATKGFQNKTGIPWPFK